MASARAGILVFCVFCLSLIAAALSLGAQTPEEGYKKDRAAAIALFRNHQELEALPLLEILAKQNPDDAAVLAALGTALVVHSATLTDEKSGNQERVRARGILTRAKQLGSTDGVMLNLLDIIPPDGAIRHDKNAEVDKAFQAGETAFAKHDYEAAIKNYTRALELDPQMYHAALFIGDSYFAEKSFPMALEWYDRAIALNPDIETAYRYEADMLTKNGEMTKARTRAIQAVVAEPYNAIPWRAVQAWVNANKLQFHAPHINTHASVAPDGGSGSNITLDLNALSSGGSAWIVYSGARANWRQKKFKETYPMEPQYRHSLAEETEALAAAASALAESSSREKSQDPDLALLQSLSQAKMIEPYVLLNGADQGIAMDYAAYRQTHRAQLEEYLDRFVVPALPEPAKP